MKKILFVTDKNVLTTSGELRLIKNRAEILYSRYGIKTDFLAFQKKNRINSSSREMINAGGEMAVIPYSMKNPIKSVFDFLFLKKLVCNQAENNEYDAIVFSGLGMSRFAKTVKRHSDIFTIIDMHGSQEDIIETAKNASLRRKVFLRLLYTFEVDSLRRNFQYMDGCFAVTVALEKYIRKNYAVKDRIEFYHVPCATLNMCPTEDDYFINRITYRDKYNIDKDEIVFIYSGGVSSWQCVGETISLFRQISKQLDCKARLLIFSHNIDAIRKLLNDEDKNIITDSYSAEELQKALNAGDFAFMLRHDCVTNNVAFPNKFLEYIQSGMKIIATPYVHDIASQIKQYDVGYLYNFDNDLTDIITYIQSEKSSKPDFEKRNNILKYNSFNERLKKLASRLNDERV